MKNKDYISILPMSDKLLYSLNDAWHLLRFKSFEAALKVVSKGSVYTIVCDSKNAEKLYYIDVEGLFELLNSSPHPKFSKLWDHDRYYLEPKCLKNNQAPHGVIYYPANVILNIQETERSSKSITTTPSEMLFSISQIAEEYNMTGHELNLYLEMKGVQRRIGKKWKVYSKYVKKHYTGTYKSNSHVYWTLEGKLFISTLLEEDNHVRKTTNE